MKKLVISLMLIISILATPVLAETNDAITKSSDEVLLQVEENDKFNDSIANVTADKKMVIDGYNRRKQRDNTLPNIDANDVRAYENIKIHAFTNIKSSDFYDGYEKRLDLNEFLDPENAIIAVYRDSKKQYVDSILFVKNTQATEKSINGWESISSATILLSEETIKFLSDKENIKNLLETTNVKNPKNLKVVTGIHGIDGAIYLEQDGKQIIIPLSDGVTYGEDIKVCSKFTPYLASDFFKARKVAALEMQKNIEKESLKPPSEKLYGLQYPINYENLEAVNLLTTNIISNDSISESSGKNSNYGSYLLAAGVGIVGISIILGVLYKRKSNCLDQ